MFNGIFSQFLDEISPKWADFSVWVRFFGLVHTQFGRIFYGLGDKLTENAVKHLNWAIFYN
jgi:hypothetical protein